MTNKNLFPVTHYSTSSKLNLCFHFFVKFYTISLSVQRYLKPVNTKIIKQQLFCFIKFLYNVVLLMFCYF